MKVALDQHVTDPAAVPAAVGRTSYRIAQECLTNARKHAPGAEVTVTVAGAPGDGLTVSVRNPAPPGRSRPSPAPVRASSASPNAPHWPGATWTTDPSGTAGSRCGPGCPGSEGLTTGLDRGPGTGRAPGPNAGIGVRDAISSSMIAS